jgi:anaerobic magnesium-protoporphyrin IX monomethyl ester cyclase
MRVGLIDPGSKKLTRACFPHLGLAYVSSSLEREGHEVFVLDAPLSTTAEREEFLAMNFDFIGITATSCTFRDALRIAEESKAQKPERPIILGGPHTSFSPKGILSHPQIDFAIYGEGEITIIELARVLGEDTHPSQNRLTEIKGLVFRDGDEITVNPPRPWIQDLDEVPFPAYHLFNLERYDHYSLITSRGCPFECIYCAASVIWGRRWRSRSPENIVQEIEFVIRHWGKNNFVICDHNFNPNTARAIELCQLLIAADLNIDWHCWGFRADGADPELLDLMRKAGCIDISVGVESANPQVLKNIKKKETIEEIAEGLNNIKKSGIRVGGMFMIGNPGDNLSTVKESIGFVEKMGIDYCEFYMALPYPSTELWTYVETNGRFLKSDFTEFHHFSDEPVFETPDFPADERRKAYTLTRRFTLLYTLKSHLRYRVKRLKGLDFSDLTLGRVLGAIGRLIRTFCDFALIRPQEV